MIVVMNHLGQSRIGCASGEPPVYPAIQYEDAEEAEQVQSDDADDVEDNPEAKQDTRETLVMAAWRAEISSSRSRLKRVRVAFIIAGSILVIASGFLLVNGIFVVKNAYDSTRSDVKQMKGVIEHNMFGIADSTQASNQASNVRNAVLAGLPQWCPNSQDNTITIPSGSLISEPKGIGVEAVGENSITLSFANWTANVEENLLSLGSFATEGQLGIHTALGEAYDKADEIEKRMTKYKWLFFLALAVIVAVDLFTMVFLVGVIQAWKGRVSRTFIKIQNFFAMPIFTFLINALCLLVCGFMITAVLSADVCTGGPERNVISIFNQQEAYLDPLLFQMTTYYVEDCSGVQTINEKNDMIIHSFNSHVSGHMSASKSMTGISGKGKPTQFLDTYITYLEDVDNVTANFLADVETIDPTTLVSACGIEVISFLNTATLLRATMAEAKTRTNLAVQGLFCSNFNPIYIDIMHEDVCYDGVGALAVISFSLLVIGICGLTMITLRVSWHEVGDQVSSIKNNDETGGENQADKIEPENQNDVTHDEEEQMSRDSVGDEETVDNPEGLNP
uniref:Uncharacterized protein n=1 Tax=Ditylum brightwellii TaxID=49249 RepID=A0A7S2ERE7_9STRA